jgi:hypothetical protein
LPYPDIGHLGIDIQSMTSLRMSSNLTMNINAVGALGINAGAALGVKSVGTMDLSSGAQLGIGAGLIVHIDGSLVNIGNGTALATKGLAEGTVNASLLPQIEQSVTALSLAQIGVQEVATVVDPGDIPPSRVPTGYTTKGNLRTRKPPPSNSSMPDDTADGE